MRRSTSLLLAALLVVALPGISAAAPDADTAADSRVAGVPVAPLFKINDGGLWTQEDNSSIAVNTTTGEYLVAWIETELGDATIYSRLLRADGAPRSEQRRLHGTATYRNQEPTALFNPITGKYVVLWYRADARTLAARVIHPDGTFAGSIRTVARNVGGNDFAAAVNEDTGEIMLVFRDLQQRLRSRILHPDARPTSQLRTVGNTWDFNYGPALAYNSIAGNFGLVYQVDDENDSGIISRRLIASTGKPTGVARLLVLSWQDDTFNRPDIAFNPDRNEFLVVFGSDLEVVAGSPTATVAGAGHRATQVDHMVGIRVDKKLRPVRLAEIEQNAGFDPTFMHDPAVAYSPETRKYLVAFGRTGEVEVRVRRVGALGDPLGGARLLSADPEAWGGEWVDIACNPISTECLVTWDDQRRQVGFGDVFGRLVTG